MFDITKSHWNGESKSKTILTINEKSFGDVKSTMLVSAQVKSITSENNYTLYFY